MQVVGIVGIATFLLVFAFLPEIHEVVWRRWIRRLPPNDMSNWH